MTKVSEEFVLLTVKFTGYWDILSFVHRTQDSRFTRHELPSLVLDLTCDIESADHMAIRWGAFDMLDCGFVSRAVVLKSQATFAPKLP